MIRLAPNHAKLLNKCVKPTKPDTRRLFWAIQRMAKFTYQAKLPVNNKAKQLFHINLLLQLTMKKSIFYVQLI